MYRAMYSRGYRQVSPVLTSRKAHTHDMRHIRALRLGNTRVASPALLCSFSCSHYVLSTQWRGHTADRRCLYVLGKLPGLFAKRQKNTTDYMPINAVALFSQERKRPFFHGVARSSLSKFWIASSSTLETARHGMNTSTARGGRSGRSAGCSGLSCDGKRR